jgi:multidrug resistance protein MdtO
MHDVLPPETPLALRARLADLCDTCARAFERGDAVPPPAEPIGLDPTFDAAPPGVRAVVFALGAALERLRHGLDLRNRGIVEPDPGARRPSPTSERDRPENIRFALKGTLAVMSAYLIYTGLDWPGISTAVTTCFFVLLGSLGESMYKSTLRISGALVGGVAAGLCIALVLPAMTDIGQLALLVAVAGGICGWVAAGSELLSYMGLQMAFAFFLGVLQGYGPATEFTVLSDRVIGILLGNVLVAVIFSSLWPTSTKARAETAIDHALDELAAFAGDGMPRAVGPRLAVLEAADHARRFASFSSFELRMIPGAEPQLGIALPELLRLAGFAFVAVSSDTAILARRSEAILVEVKSEK